MDRSSSLRDFTRSLSSAGKASKWTSCLASLETALQTALRLDAFALSAAMNACDRGGPWRWGLELQRALEERHLEVDTACVATAISSVARRHAWTGGVHLLEELRISTLPLSTTACANALRAFPHWQSALQLVFNALAQRLWPEPFLGNLLLTQMPKEASCLVQMRVLQIQLDVVSYNTMLSSCASWKDALQTFQLMSTHIQAPNSISQTCLIAACATAWRSALATTVSSSLSAHSAAAVAARRSGRWMVSLSLLTELKGRHIEGDTAAFNEEVNAQSASWSTALSRFHATGARDWGLPARDSVTVTVLLSALLKTLQWPIAMVLLEESAATGLAQDSVDDFAFLKAAVAAGEDHVVKKLLATSISSAWSFFQAANTAAARNMGYSGVVGRDFSSASHHWQPVRNLKPPFHGCGSGAGTRLPGMPSWPLTSCDAATPLRLQKRRWKRRSGTDAGKFGAFPLEGTTAAEAVARSFGDELCSLLTTDGQQAALGKAAKFRDSQWVHAKSKFRWSFVREAWRDTMAILEDVAAPEATVLRGQSAISLTTGVPHHR
ncbi:Pentatricopeptide repeat-containing protein MRL1 [Durusdinium trenchii]|uniref:Chloroplastic (Protein MATURATION OF RBCL 1) (AtMRL1) n=1 Tax=Durusdinium trenchii TaxID=1381693 RepID=A0ABP0QN56_9DINO